MDQSLCGSSFPIRRYSEATAWLITRAVPYRIACWRYRNDHDLHALITPVAVMYATDPNYAHLAAAIAGQTNVTQAIAAAHQGRPMWLRLRAALSCTLLAALVGMAVQGHTPPARRDCGRPCVTRGHFRRVAGYADGADG